MNFYYSHCVVVLQVAAAQQLTAAHIDE